jgi:transketolase
VTIRQLELRANKIRQSIIEMLVAAKSGHTAGPLDMADIFTALYFEILTHRPHQPKWEGRDRVVLSNGHIAPVLYAALAHAGYFPVSKLVTLRKLGSPLQGHPHNLALPGVEVSGGPLGQGLSQAIGMALAARLDKQSHRIYALLSDGEQQEGQTWEAVMFAGHYKLSNLTAIIDRNNIQIDGPTEKVMALEPLKAKYEAFNWHVVEIDGHNMREIIDACEVARAIVEKPTLILARTIAGKGVEFMEYDYRWHGSPPGKGPTDKVPAKEQAKEALESLRDVADDIRHQSV